MCAQIWEDLRHDEYNVSTEVLERKFTSIAEIAQCQSHAQKQHDGIFASVESIICCPCMILTILKLKLSNLASIGKTIKPP